MILIGIFYIHSQSCFSCQRRQMTTPKVFQESLKRSITKPSNPSENIVSAIRKKCISDDGGGIFENDGSGIFLISK